MMVRRVVLALCVLLLVPPVARADAIRELALSEDEIGRIRMALDLSTVLKFEGRPNQAILGAQDAFKVEFVHNSVTLKPIQPGVRTNLLVFTDQESFYFNLVPVPQVQADQLVRVRRRAPKVATSKPDPSKAPRREPTALVHKEVRRSAERDGARLTVHSVGWPRSGRAVVIGFSVAVSGSKAGPMRFAPAALRLVQGNEDVVIQDLFLESLALAPGEEAKGVLLVRTSAFRPKGSVELHFLREKPGKSPLKPISVAIPRVGPLQEIPPERRNR